MLYLVEGLNASGKSTWIKSNKTDKDKSIVTTYANPLRWKKDKVCLIHNDVDFILGAYESLFYIIKDMLNDIPDIYLDRSFISGYVYGTIEEKCEFEYLAEMFYKLQPKIIFMETDIDVCKDRWQEGHKKNKKYVTNFDWEGTRKKFINSIKYLKEIGYGVKIVK